MLLLGDKCISQAALGTTETSCNLWLSIIAFLKVPGPFSGGKMSSSSITQKGDFWSCHRNHLHWGWALAGFHKRHERECKMGRQEEFGRSWCTSSSLRGSGLGQGSEFQEMKLYLCALEVMTDVSLSVIQLILDMLLDWAKISGNIQGTSGFW